jgi:hypothetical protein
MRHLSKSTCPVLCLFGLLCLVTAQSLFAGSFRTNPATWMPGFLQQMAPVKAGILFLISGSTCLFMCAQHIRKIRIPDPVFSRSVTLFLLAFILVLSVPIKLYELPRTPLGAYNDEIVKGMQVLKILEGEPFQPFFVSNKEFLFFYLLTPFIRFFGPTIGALRILPFLCGIITVFVSWLLFERLWGRAAAFAGSGFLAVGLWPGQSSHICERLNAVPMFTAATLYFILMAVQTRRVWAWLASGVVMAGGMWTFPSFRMIPAGIFLFLIWSFFTKDLSIRRDAIRIVIFLSIFAVFVSAPLQWDLDETLSTFLSRKEHDFKIASNSEQILIFSRQLLASVTVDAREDMSFTPQSHPLLWWPLGALFLAGLITVILQMPLSSSVFILLWLMSALVPAIVSEPFARRLTAVQPAVFGLTGFGAWVMCHAVLPVIKHFKAFALIPVGSLIIVTGIINFHYFTHVIAPEWSVAAEDYWMVQTAIEFQDRYDVFLDQLEEEAELPYRFLTYPRTQNLRHFQAFPPAFSIPFRFDSEKDLIYLFRNIPENTKMIPLLTALYPDGVLSLHQTDRYRRGFFSFTLARESLETSRGIEISIAPPDPDAVFTDISNRTFSHDTFAVDIQSLIQQDVPLDEPLDWILSGMFLANRLGRHDFLLHGPDNSMFFVDNVFYEPAGISDEGSFYHVFLTDEPHLITLTFSTDAPDQPRVELTMRNMETPSALDTQPVWEIIPSRFLLRPPAPVELTDPIPVQKADFQYAHSEAKQQYHPVTSQLYDIARIEALPDGRFIANCWYLKCMVILDRHATIIEEWNANIGNDPYWQRRFDFDVDSDGTVYLTGDSRNILLAASPDGQLLRTIRVPSDCRVIHIDSSDSALILCRDGLFRIALSDGTVLNRIDLEKTNLDRAMALTTDESGHIYLADPSSNVVRVFTPGGRYQRCFRIPGPLTDSFGIRFDSSGHLYVPHVKKHFTACFSPDGILQTGSAKYMCDPLDSRRVPIPRYVFFPDSETLWITNADTVHIMERVE